MLRCYQSVLTESFLSNTVQMIMAAYPLPRPARQACEDVKQWPWRMFHMQKTASRPPPVTWGPAISMRRKKGNGRYILAKDLLFLPYCCAVCRPPELSLPDRGIHWTRTVCQSHVVISREIVWYTVKCVHTHTHTHTHNTCNTHTFLQNNL